MIDEKFLAEVEARTRKVVREELLRLKKAEEPLLTIKQVIEKLGCSYSTFKVMDATLNFPSHLVGRRPMYKESEVREAIKSSNFTQHYSRHKVLNI